MILNEWEEEKEMHKNLFLWKSTLKNRLRLFSLKKLMTGIVFWQMFFGFLGISQSDKLAHSEKILWLCDWRREEHK